MRSPLEERVRELEGELAGARARVKELEELVEMLGGMPGPNAQVEGADVTPELPL